ncbi:MAG TPA: lipid-A-disaccharide synthase [Verrucomicrobiae bacterium]|nr:lipid-A-disaccharide synthase [Verrucomicrobiae bacterium]
MVPRQFMIVAGEPSGDLLAADLVRALREEIAAGDYDGAAGQPLRASLEPRFFGAGGPAMVAAGVELLFDLTQHAVTGLSDALRKIFTFRRLLLRLARTAVERQPQAIICVDYSGFNLRLAAGIRKEVNRRKGIFRNWDPKIIQFVSPQVWASRPGRAHRLAQNVDLLLSIFPFEKDWYGEHAPALNVEFVGHPIVDRYAGFRESECPREPGRVVVFLPGSRIGELRRHVPVMGEAAGALGKARKAMVLPNAALAEIAKTLLPNGSNIQVQVGGLPELLSHADLAIAATGTVTMECAYFGVPTVAMYKTSPLTYEIGKRIIKVKYLSMPNLLANEALFPEFVQDAATPENLARVANELLANDARRVEIREKLPRVIGRLGPPGASRRAAQAINSLLLNR